MFGVTDHGAFVIAFIIVLAIPGPGNFALITATGKGGMAATCGVILGDRCCCGWPWRWPNVCGPIHASPTCSSGWPGHAWSGLASSWR